MKKLLYLFLSLVLISCSNSTSSQRNEIEDGDFVFKINYSSIGTSLVVDSEYLSPQGELNFGDLDEGKKIIRSLVLKNQTEKNINLNIHPLSSPYSVRVNRCLTNLLPGKSCKVEIQAVARNNFSEEFEQALLISFVIDSENYSTRIDLNSNPLKVKDYTGNWQVDVDFGDRLNYEIGIRPFPQKILIENTSNQIVEASQLIPQISNGFVIRTNRCLGEIKPKQKCTITIMYLDYRKSVPSGNEEMIINTSKEISKKFNILSGEEISDIVVAPEITNLDLNMEVEIERLGSIQLVSLGNDLSWTLISQPTGVSINQLGALSWTPSLQQMGNYSFKVRASNSKGFDEKTINVIVKPKIDMGSLIFNEGDILDPLLNFSVKSKSIVEKLSGNFSTFFTFVRLRKDFQNIDNFSRRNDLNSISMNALTSNFTSYGAVKKATNNSLNIVVHMEDGESYSYSFPIIILSNNLPFFYYNIIAVKGSSQSGDFPLSVFENALEMKKSMSNWRTPILTEYKVDNIMCGGNLVESYFGNNNSLIDCLKNLVSSNSETSFWFESVYSDGGTRQIGGRAHGARKGVVVSANNYVNTLAHEYGHNLGLFHTFESVKNQAFYHSQSGEGSIYFSVEKTKAGDNASYPGDWINGRIDYESAQNIKTDISFSGIIDDTLIDFYGAKAVFLNNPYHPIVPNPIPYINGDLLFFMIAQDSNFSLNSNVCSQGLYNSQKTWSPVCSNSKVLPLSVINNSMSYWDKYDGESVFSTGQKLRMDRVLDRFNEIGGD